MRLLANEHLLDAYNYFYLSKEGNKLFEDKAQFFE